MDRLAHKYWSDVFKQSHDAKTEQTNHRNRTLKEDEMPEQGKSDIPVRIRRTVAHTNLQVLESPELQQQFTSNQEQVQNISPRCVMVKRIYHEGESQPHQPLDQEEQSYPQQSKTYRKNHQSPGNQQKIPIQNVPQHQAEKPPQDQFKQQPQQKYRETANQNSTKKLSDGNTEMNKTPCDMQTHKNTAKIMEQCQQAEYQNPPEKILSENQFKQHPTQEYRETGYQKSIKKYRHRIPHNMQQPDNVYNVTPHMKLHHLKTEFQDLPVRDQYIDRTETTPHDQCKQQPQQEYRKSYDQLQQQPQGKQECSYQNFTKKTSLENPQNMQQPDGDHNITPHMKLHHLKAEYQDLPMKNQYVDPPQAPPQDQLKQQQHLEYQDIAYQKYSKKTLLKNFLNMQQNPYKGHVQVPPHDQFKQQPHQQNLDNSNQNSTTKPSLKNPQSMQQSTQQPHVNHPQESQMYRKDNQNLANQKYLLAKQKERYPSPTPTPYQNVPQHQAEQQQYPKASHHHSRKHQSNDNPQQGQQLPQQPLLICDNHKNTAMLPTEYQKYPKKEPYEDPLQAPPHDQLKQQPSQEYRGESFCHSLKQSQKQPLSNAPQEQAQLNLSESNSMAKVLPVPRPEPNRRRVPHNSFMGYKFKVKKSPEGCKKDNPKKVSKGKQCKNENQLFDATAFQISAKTGDELRSMVREEMELQMLLMELSEITKKGEILDATPSTCDKSATSKSLESNETPSTSSSASSEESQIDHDITVHSIVNGKVITPMIRKIQNMYIRNLRYELDLVEYLQQVPGHVTEVCRDAGCKDQNKLEK